MEAFLSKRAGVSKYLLVAEAIGYQGAKFTGVPLVSERMLTGNHEIKPSWILGDFFTERTSRPDGPGLKDSQRLLGFTEPTATIIWKEIMKNEMAPFDIMTWNIFPFHPFKLHKGTLTNRTPKEKELQIGSHYLKMIMGLFPGIAVISVGRHSSKTLDSLGIKNIHVPHPANGGARKFRDGIKRVFAK